MAAIIANDRAGPLFTISGDPNNPAETADIAIPSLLMTVSDGLILKSHLQHLEVDIFAAESYETDPRTNEVRGVPQPVTLQIKAPDSLNENEIVEWLAREVGKYGIAPSQELFASFKGLYSQQGATKENTVQQKAPSSALPTSQSQKRKGSAKKRPPT